MSSLCNICLDDKEKMSSRFHVMWQEVIVLGSGAFACEAMDAAIANNAKHVTMVCRDRKR
jgi:signal-transduction protein with cAMP-binding, CBS, and nucleotidyltransferase domain